LIKGSIQDYDSNLKETIYLLSARVNGSNLQTRNGRKVRNGAVMTLAKKIKLPTSTPRSQEHFPWIIQRIFDNMLHEQGAVNVVELV